jgi:hypothetical protein
VDSITGTLLDGHNRYRICSEKNIPFEIKEISMSRKERQKEFILINQLARRNLTQERMEYYIAMLYRSIKSEVGFEEGHEFKGNQHTKDGNVVQGQNDLTPNQSNKAAREVAKKVNKSERTVRRIDKKIEAIEKAGKIQEHTAGKLPKKEIKAIVDAAKPVRKQTKAEADEEAEILSSPENQHLLKEMPSNNKSPVDQYNRVRKLVEKLKSLGLTSDEKQYIKTELEVA